MTSPHRSSLPREPLGFRRAPRVADLMTHDLHRFVDHSLAAERVGDAATALEYHQGVPMFARSGHRVLLRQLSDLAEDMTPWLWARWAAYQCTRFEDRGTVGAAIVHAALQYVIEMFHADAMDDAYCDGRDPVRIASQVLGEDWAYQQICTYELGGLERFLASAPPGRLLDEASLAREWVGALVSGYRVESRSPGSLTVRDLGDDRVVELLDLGATVPADDGGWLIGRLVSTGTEPAWMFDTRPLCVDEQTARDASTGDRRGAWITALRAGIRDGRVPEGVLLREDRELATDVPSLDLLRRGTPPGTLASAMDQLARGRDEVGRAAFRLLRSAAEGSLDGDDAAAYVSAAVVNVHGYAEAQRVLTRAVHRAAWQRWSQVTVDPARGRLQRLAGLCATAAA